MQGARPRSVSGVSQVHISWPHKPTSGFTVIWQTELPDGPNKVEYHAIGHDRWQTVSSRTFDVPGKTGKGCLHRVDIEGLEPDREYEYRVSTDHGTSHAFRTRTAPSAGMSGITFAFISDTGLIGRKDGNSTGIEQVIDELIRDAPLFILGGGDYTYSDNDCRYAGDAAAAIDEWFHQWEPVISRSSFMPQYGNHDTILDGSFEDWAPRVAVPRGHGNGRSYSFDVGDVHFVSLFVPKYWHAKRFGNLRWLARDLARARRRKSIRWIIVYQHDSVFASGRCHPSNARLRRKIAPILEKYRVDLLLSAHDQNFERTFPLTGAGNGRPCIGSVSADRYKQGEGVIYASISPSGKLSDETNDFSRFTGPQEHYIAARNDTLHHYGRINVSPEGRMEVITYGLKGDGSDKKVIDRFVIER